VEYAAGCASGTLHCVTWWADLGPCLPMTGISTAMNIGDPIQRLVPVLRVTAKGGCCGYSTWCISDHTPYWKESTGRLVVGEHNTDIPQNEMCLLFAPHCARMAT
jgi:hypothetical protein